MGLFTGFPNPGYLGSATYAVTGGSTITFRVAGIEQEDGMNWNDATICNSGGVADYGKGISEGLARIRCVWDTASNQEAGMVVGASGTLTLSLGAVGTNHSAIWTAYLRRRSVAFTARGLVSMTALFLLVAAGIDFGNTNPFNNPSVS